MSRATLLARSKQPIVYDLRRTENGGWQLHVLLPKRISPSDRIKVLDWLHDYRTEVRRERPGWLTAFRACNDAYFLDMIPATSPENLLSQTIGEWVQLELFDRTNG